ncbi:MAG: LysR family transcriptional regulator [Myxococcales bacterium]|nr:LysR family transcriptional regulator [Myxococcales bacterium]
MDRLTQMEAFIRVVDAGSFSAAAQGWDRSKALVSKHIAALETSLGVALLERTTRSLRLTETGQHYYERCVELLGEIEQLETSVQGTHLAPQGLLRVTMTPSSFAWLEQALWEDFAVRYPDVLLDLHLTHRHVDLVEEGFHVAVRVTTPQDSSLIARKLCPVPVLAVASPSYLERAGYPTQPTDLREHACLIDTNFRDAGRWPFLVDGQKQVVHVTGPARVNSPTVVRSLALRGMGIALCPSFAVQEDLKTGHLRQLFVGQVALEWAAYALFARRHLMSGKVRAFVEFLIEVFQKQPFTETKTTVNTER